MVNKFWEHSPTWKTGTQPESVRKKLSAIRKGIKFSEEWKANISKNHADVSGKNNPMYRKKHSFETKVKQSEKARMRTPAFLGRKHTEQSKLKIKLHHADVSGERNCNWRGGIKYLPYTFKFKKQIKFEVRIRDKFTCQLCLKQASNPPIHHIDYDKKNDDMSNLICLCNVCHAKTNANRKYWMEYFNEMMKKRVEEKGQVIK